MTTKTAITIPHLQSSGRSGRGSSLAPASNPPVTLEAALAGFLVVLHSKNRSAATIQAYTNDVSQFITWVHDNNITATGPDQIEKVDITEFLAFLGQRHVSGVSRARKLAAIREYFRYLEGYGFLMKSPATGVETPKREKNVRTWLRPEEYTRMLSLAGASPRDYAILQVFLQTGVRVSELCDLRLGDLDLNGKTVAVRGKGMVERTIELEKKGIRALRNWLTARPEVPDDHLFLNYQGDPISKRGVEKLVVKYRVRAGIARSASCHSLRHTFGTYKAEQGVSAFQLKEWLGHANLNTTQIYVHMARKNARKVMEATSL